jgi:hypothetical protein
MAELVAAIPSGRKPNSAAKAPNIADKIMNAASSEDAL